MSVLPATLHSVVQIKAIEAYAIERLGIPAYSLMVRAATAALLALRTQWPDAKRLLVVCGFGNNAGDGYVLARLAVAEALQVEVVSVARPETLSGAAQQAWQDYLAEGGVTQPWHCEKLNAVDVVVDAILGTGLSRPLDATVQSIVRQINASSRPVFALDVPTGIDADTGQVRGAAIRARCTMSFIGLKQGLYIDEGPDHAGKPMFDDLGLSAQVRRDEVDAVALLMDERMVEQALPRRPRNAHKGQHGHVLIVGGGLGMPGAVGLCGEACLRAGAGWVTLATRPEHVGFLIAARPELMGRGVMSAVELGPLLHDADVIAVGPGLGQDAWARALFEAVLATEKPLIIDADALNLLALHPQQRSNWVLTPHPGEAARLLNVSNAEVQHSRMQALQALQSRYHGVVVLKGMGTLVAAENQRPSLCGRGNPGMAIPGMGDVLTGIIAGIAAQQAPDKRDLALAARAGVYVHATAGDLAAQKGERGLLASDVFEFLPLCLNP